MAEDHGSCPHCGADLNGGFIWVHFYKELQRTGYYHGASPLSAEEAAIKADEIAANYGATRTEGKWGREIGIYDTERDRTVSWECPDCNGEWSR